MAIPKDPAKNNHMFFDNMKFLQKVVVFHPNNGKILVLKRSPRAHSRPNCWDLPGGNVLFGENHLDSLIREITEETSLVVVRIQPIQVMTKYENGVYYLFIGYSGTAISSKVKISQEHTGFRWVTIEEFLRLNSADFLIDLVKQCPSYNE